MSQIMTNSAINAYFGYLENMTAGNGLNLMLVGNSSKREHLIPGQSEHLFPAITLTDSAKNKSSSFLKV